MRGVSESDVDNLSLPANIDYGRNRAAPSDRDEEIKQIMLRFMNAQSSAHAVSLMGVGRGHGDVLLTFAERIAPVAVNRRSVEDLRSGLTAVALAYQITDWRDALAVLALLYRAAELITGDANAELAIVAHQLDGKSGQILRDFANRPPAAKSITGFNYSEGRDNNGFYFRQMPL